MDTATKLLLNEMTPMEKFHSYDSLVSEGVTLNITELASELVTDYFADKAKSEVFFKENYDWFLNRGLSLDDLLEYTGRLDDETYFRNNFKWFLDQGRSWDYVLGHAGWNEFYDINSFYEVFEKFLLPDELIGDFIINTCLCSGGDITLLDISRFALQHGASVEQIKKFLDRNDDPEDSLFKEMIFDDYQAWKEIGVDLKKYAKTSIQSRFCWNRDYSHTSYVGPLELYRSIFSEVPESFKEQIVEFIEKEMPMEVIVDDDYEEFERFVPYLVDNGVNIKAFAKRFTDEVGYDYSYLSELIEADTSILGDGIDIDKYIDCLLEWAEDIYDDDEIVEYKKHRYDDLVGKYGVTEEKAARLIS